MQRISAYSILNIACVELLLRKQNSILNALLNVLTAVHFNTQIKYSSFRALL